MIDWYATDDNMVNYSAFCDSIDSIFTIKGLEKMPTARVKPIEAHDTDLAWKKYLEFDEREQGLMIEICQAYK